jgi:hypothetical protein
MADNGTYDNPPQNADSVSRSGGTVQPLTVATVHFRDEVVPDRGGIYGGRVWHYRSTKWTGRNHLTACGEIFEPHWRPGYRNTHPKTCAKCVKVWAAQTGRTAAQIDRSEADNG